MHPIRILRSVLICSTVGLLVLSSQSAVLASRSGPLVPAIQSRRTPIGPRVPGGQLWWKRYDGGHDFASALGVSPDGTKVFVTGQSGGLSFRAYATIAYDAVSGAELWVQRYGDFGDINQATALGVSPDGSRVFVTGSSNGQFGTIAYEASSGAQLWVDLYGGAAGASSIDLSPDGAQVFVTGRSEGDYATIAYDASSGTRQWVSFYDDGGASAIAVTPDGTKVFVTGTSGSAYATIAYDTLSGATLWASRYEGLPGRETLGTSIGVSPSGTRVFVTGGIGQPSGVTYGTIAYDASTGSTLWVSFYGGLKCCSRHVAWSLGVSGSTVFVTGESERAPSDIDYATVAYDASSGKTLWAQRFSRGIPERDIARSLVVSPDGASVYVTGTSGDDYATISYEAITGKTTWVSRFDGFGGEARSIGISPDGTRVFITGYLFVEPPFEDYVTVAYSTR